MTFPDFQRQMEWCQRYFTKMSLKPQTRRQDFATGGPKVTRGEEHFFNRMLDVCSNRYAKSRLQHVNFNCILLDPENYSDMKAEPTEHCHLLLQLGQGKRQ